MRGERMNQSTIEEVMGKNFPKWMKPNRFSDSCKPGEERRRRKPHPGLHCYTLKNKKERQKKEKS